MAVGTEGRSAGEDTYWARFQGSATPVAREWDFEGILEQAQKSKDYDKL
jgi:hypothetical protein